MPTLNNLFLDKYLSSAADITNMSDKFRHRVEMIAKRLLEIEQRTPGTVCLRVNPAKVDTIAQTLQEMGLKRGIFEPKRQFIIDSFLYVPGVAETLLPSTLLVGSLQESRVPCWKGTGAFTDFQSRDQSTDFEREGKENIILMVHIEPFFNHIAGLLDEPPNVSAEDPVELWKYGMN